MHYLQLFVLSVCRDAHEERTINTEIRHKSTSHTTLPISTFSKSRKLISNTRNDSKDAENKVEYKCAPLQLTIS